MPKALTEDQVVQYRDEGFTGPVRIMSGAEATELRTKFEALEQSAGGEVQSRYKIKAHLPFPWLCDLIRHPVMLDAVEDLIGPNILCWGASFFTKKAHDPRFVSWHQDSTYYGLRPAETVTTWVAFSDSTEQAGCVEFIPGSHRHGIVDHEETWNKDNLLMRGQTINDVEVSKAVKMELGAGEISIHHESVVHGSGPNNADHARIGMSIHYIPPHVRQTAFDGATAMVVRGTDTEGHWGVDPEPERDFDPACLAALDAEFEKYKTGVGKL